MVRFWACFVLLERSLGREGPLYACGGDFDGELARVLFAGRCESALEAEVLCKVAAVVRGCDNVAAVPGGGEMDNEVDFEEGRVGVLIAGMRAEGAVVGEAEVGDCRGSLKVNSKGVNAFSSPLRSRFRELLKSPVALRLRLGGGCIGDLLGGDGLVGERC